MHLSWKAYLLPLLLVLTLGPILVLGSFTYSTIYSSLTNYTLQRRIALARQGSISIEERLDRLVDLAKLESNEDRMAEMVTAGKWDQAVALIKNLPDVNPLVDRILIADAKGIEKSAYPYDATVIGQDFSGREWYKGVSQKWAPYVSGIYRRAAAPQKNVIAISTPIFSSPGGGGEPLAILVLQIPVSAFDFVEVGDSTAGLFYVVDHNGNTIFHPSIDTEQNIINVKDSPPVKMASQGSSGYIQFYSEGDKEAMLSAFYPLSKYGWATIMSQPASAAFFERDSILKSMILIWALLCVFSFVLSLAIYRFLVMLSQFREREGIILDGLGEAVIVVDPKGQIVYVNQATEKLTGYTKRELIQQSIMFLKLLDEKERPIPAEGRPVFIAGKSKKTASFQYFLRSKSGRTVPIYITASPLIEESKLRGMVTVFADVTERHELEKAKDDFITTAAHQLNSPLGQIRWNLDLFLKKFSKNLPKQAHELIANAHDSTTSLAALVNDLLIATRVSQGRLQEHPVPFAPVEALRKYIQGLEPFIKDAKLKVSLEVVGEVRMLNLDQLAFQQVFENILRNAIKYNKISGSIDVRIEGQDDSVLISVADTGIGIPESEMTSVYSRFFRASNAQKMMISGTGLGLYVVKSYVDRWNGKIEIESRENEGTVVRVRIPYEPNSVS